MKLGARIHHKAEAGRRYALENLKRCPLCGTVNSASNSECMTCRWHGDFDHEPESIQTGLAELLEKCPDLAEAVLAPPSRRRRRGIVGWIGMVKWLVRGRLDLKV